MVRRLIHTALTLLIAANALAQVKVTIKAPSQAEEGVRFQLSYTVNTQNVEDFQTGDFPDEIEILYGPTASRQSSYSIINGKSSSTSSITYTYTLIPNKAGTYKLPAGVAKSGGKEYKSGQASIQVLPSAGGGKQQGPSRVRTQDAGDQITAKDLYITVTANKTEVYEQEAVVLTYKLYTLVSIESCNGEMPDLDGFLVQELPLPQQKSLKYENVNGKNYGTVVRSQVVLYTQSTGTMKVTAKHIEATEGQQNRTVDPFEAFFSGGASLVRVNKTVTAPAIEIQVNPLPAKPAGFSGAVGTDFHISGSLTPEQVDANDAVQLRLVVSGTGNMKLMNYPAVDWPKDFETYDPKVDDKTKIGTAGTTGNIVYDYTAVPRHGGKYTIPPVKFCYFDTAAKTYKTVATDSFTVAVAKTASKVTRDRINQEDLRVLNDDIRYIKIGNKGASRLGNTFFGTTAYLVAYLIPLLLFLIFALIWRKASRRNGNTAGIRRRKAGKAAAKRLKLASRLMREGKATDFYNELTRALWGYVSDKLNLPLTSLSKDNVGQELRQRNVDDALAQRFLTTLEDCEFAQYAPGDPAENMDKLYTDATDIINLLDTKL